MAQIQSWKGGGRIIWSAEDWTEGLAPNYGTSTTTYQKGNKKLVAARAMNPFRSYGNAYPGYVSTDVANVSEVTDKALKGVVYGANAFIVTAGAKLQKLSLDNNSLTASFHSITAHSAHTSVISSDCVLYQAKVGGTSALRYFYSWSDAVSGSSIDWDVGTYDLTSTPPTGVDDDFMSTAPATPLVTATYASTAYQPHPLIVGDDDILYIGDRNFVHAYDGQNSADNDGKFFPAVLTLPNGFIITSFAKTQAGLMIFATFTNPLGIGSAYVYRGTARAFLWDYVSLDITYAYDLNDNSVGEAFQYRGTVGCFTAGNSKDPSASTKLCKIQLFTGTEFKVVETFLGNLPVRGGVDVEGDAIYFNSDGIIHCWGSPLFGVKSGLNKLGEGSGSASGMLGNFTNNYQYFSSGTTTSGGLQYSITNHTSGGYNANGQLATPIIEPAFLPAQHGRVTAVKVNYADTTTSANSRALTVSLRPRGGSSSTIISAETDIGSRETSVTRHLDTSGNALPEFEAIKLILQWATGNGSTDAPGVSSVEVFFESVNV